MGCGGRVEPSSKYIFPSSSSSSSSLFLVVLHLDSGRRKEREEKKKKKNSLNIQQRPTRLVGSFACRCLVVLHTLSQSLVLCSRIAARGGTQHAAMQPRIKKKKKREGYVQLDLQFVCVCVSGTARDAASDIQMRQLFPVHQPPPPQIL